jgi:hypothetical protein
MYRVAAAIPLVVASCIGDVPTGGGGAIDAAVSDGRADAQAIRWIDAAPGTGNNLPCENPVMPVPQNGHHNTGKSCFQSCHNHGFTLAGTLYTNATGNTGFGGATISVTDAANKTIKVVVNSNGNFYTSDSLTFPVLVIASSCPSAKRMNGSTPNGNCNACHVGGTNDQMHLP